MKTIHYVAGLPRSGSTLFCNVLNQNPRFYATGTSALVNITRKIIEAYSTSPEVQSQIDAEKDLYFKRFENVLKCAAQGWHACRDKPVIFDKSRAWTANWTLLKKVYKNPKMIVVIRDLRSIAASIEWRANETVLYGDQLPILVDARITASFDNGGVVGGPMMALADLYHRKYLDDPNIFVLRHEDFCTDPKTMMERIYKFLDEESFQHDFENIERVTNEDDSVYRYTYPHQGSGKIMSCVVRDWEQILPQEINKTIRQKYDWYYKLFY